MAAGILLVPNWTPALDSDGAPIPNARAYYYVDETTTLAAIFADEALSIPLPNPVEANSSGRWPIIWASDANTYTWSIDAPYGPPGIPFTGTGLQASQATDILVAETVAAAATEATTAATAAEQAYADIVAYASSADPTNPAVIANKADLDGSNILGADQASFPNQLTVLQTGTGTVSRSLPSKIRDTINAKDWGVTLDGTTDDTAAWRNLLANAPAGADVYARGFSRITGTLVWQKPLNLSFGTREDGGFLVDAGTYKATPDGKGCVIWLPHSTTVVPGEATGIDARRSVLRGFTIKPKTTSPANLRGLVMTVVAHAKDISVDSLSSDGIAVLASNNPGGEPIPNLPLGNANKFTLDDCRAFSNGGKGIYIAGNNANAGRTFDVVAANNTGNGLEDQSLLGNRHDSPEVDGNTGTGIVTSTLSGSRTTLVAPYSETAPHMSLGTGTTVINPQGLYKPNTASGGVQLAALPATGYMTQPTTWASTDDIANSNGDTPNAGNSVRISTGRIDLKANSGGLHVVWTGANSTNYTDLMNGTDVVFRLANAPITGNLNPPRPWLMNGFVIGGNVAAGIVGASSSSPSLTGIANDGTFLKEGMTVGGNWGWAAVGGVAQPVGIVGGVQGVAVANAVNAAGAPTQAEFNAVVTVVNNLLTSLRNGKLIAT